MTPKCPDCKRDQDDCVCVDPQERIEELERDLLNLVCRIHRDGGHYIAKYGEAKAIADADTVAAQNNADLDAVQAENVRLREALDTTVKAIMIFRNEPMLKQLHKLRASDGYGVLQQAMDIGRDALASPSNTSALEAIVAKAGEKMREMCIAEFLTRTHWYAEENIRALPAVTLEDLK